MTSKFKREPASGLILVNIEIDHKYDLKMILDTGATNTTIDSNALFAWTRPKGQYWNC